MKITVRKAAERGRADFGWLDSRHTFSFGEYWDPQQMGFRTLRVINEDRVAAGAGFPTHGHRDMEIFSYVLSGALEHQDSMGNGRILRPGEVQLMSAGSGVRHSEFNPSKTEPTHFLQLWIEPHMTGLKPSYAEWKPTAAQASAAKVLLLSMDGRDGSAKIHQDAAVWRVLLAKGESLAHELADGRGAWLQLARGAATVNGIALAAGDGAATEGAGPLAIVASEPVEALLFDLK
ncbi:MAG: pirin family protein [Planctomycetes bacterium]|nr:pirin family protein [Planctomycetota bacterium]